MVFRNSLICLFIFALVFASPTLAAAPSDYPEWEIIAPGIEFRQFQLPDPNNVFVVRMDRSDLSVTLESSIAQGKLAEGRESVSSMYNRYNQALNFWGGGANPPTWDMRNQVIVAINGIYFDWNNGVPQGGQVQSGWYAKRFDDFGGYSGFAWKLDRNAFIGECVYHRPEKQLITYLDTGDTQRIAGVNKSRGSNELIIFTPQYNTRTATDSAGVEVLVEMTRPTMILPEPNYASGIVRQIRNNQGNSLIRFNHIVLSASGTAAEILLENVEVGDEIGVSQEITSCPDHDTYPWTKTFSSIQGHFFFLKDGQIQEYDDDDGATTRHPRTAIAFNDQYIFFIVVDGRDLEHSLGMTINELALFTRDTLEAESAVAEDGGGSSTMVINGQVVNNTYCNIYSCLGGYHTYLPLSIRNSQMEQSNPPVESDIIRSAAGIERAVANGMLMVIAETGAYSFTFEAGDPVTVIDEIELRLGPGTNYASFTTISAGTNGIILEQMNELNGVQAKSQFWWYVDFAGVSGWVQESALANP